MEFLVLSLLRDSRAEFDDFKAVQDPIPETNKIESGGERPYFFKFILSFGHSQRPQYQMGFKWDFVLPRIL